MESLVKTRLKLYMGIVAQNTVKEVQFAFLLFEFAKPVLPGRTAPSCVKE
jgi:hypothetical protein